MAPPQPEWRPATIDFLREEVVEICAALALGGTLLRRLGLGPEAYRLEALFGSVESRLAADQLVVVSEDSADPSPLSPLLPSGS